MPKVTVEIDTEQWAVVLKREFPLFNDDGLDEESHIGEWAMQQDRKRLHRLIDELIAAAPRPEVGQQDDFPSQDAGFGGQPLLWCDDPKQSASRPVPKCLTCNDNGMIGGPSYYQPDEGGVPCPACTPKVEPRPVPSEETGWLIENGGAAYTLYRCINNDMGMSIEWTPDPDKALRFARKEDAQAFAYHDEDAVRIAEHMWCGDAPRPVPTPPKDECCCGETDQSWRLCKLHGVWPSEPDGGAV